MDPRLDLVRQRMIRGGAAGVQAWLERVAGGAILDAPIDEGTLRGSNYVEIQVDENSVSGRTGFPLVYAAAQHEGIEFHHPRGGKAKYLEDEYKARIHEFTPTIAAAVERTL